MRDGTASFTAQWVAWMRHLANELPADELLASDPYASRFVPRLSVLRLLRPRGPVRLNVLAMQLRTRFIDDEVRAFHEAGGRQVLILGAGFDTRGERLAMPGLAYFEVDHPATQERKREAMGAPARVRYLAWHFERDALGGLRGALEKLGHDGGARTLVIWEGVAMYLTARAIDDTLAMVRGLGAGSRLVCNYFDARQMKGVWWKLRPERVFVGLVGEPFRSGFDPTTLRAFFATRGFELERDESYREVAARMYGENHARRGQSSRRMAVARVAG